MQGMFDKNIFTFNPGWSSNGRPLRELTDIRKLQRQLKDRGVTDPDGNTILVDQHV